MYVCIGTRQTNIRRLSIAYDFASHTQCSPFATTPKFHRGELSEPNKQKEITSQWAEIRTSPRRRRRHRTRRCRDFHHPLSADVACSILCGGAFVQLVSSCGTDAFGHVAFVAIHGIGAETSKIENTHEARWIDSISLSLSPSLSLSLCIYVYCNQP